MNLQNTLISVIMNRAKHVSERFHQSTYDPLNTQYQKLISILRKNMDTEYGVRYGFSTIRTIKDFQRQVPVVDYEDIREDVDRVAKGARQVFTAEDPVMFARTSGTMGKPKLIIVTPTCKGAEHTSVSSVWGYHLMTAHPDISQGKTVSLVSTAIEGYTESGIPYGSTSGSIYMSMPIIFRRNYSIPYEVFTIKDYQAKYYTLMRLAIEHDTRAIGTANPSSILKMCEKCDQFSEMILRDIYDGTLSYNFNIQPDVRNSIEKRLSPNRERSICLGRLRHNRKGKLLPSDYWPNLAVITCWKGGTVGHYVDKFPQWFDPEGVKHVPVRDWGYLSSEARCSIPLTDQGCAGPLAVETNFYEFVNVDDLKSDPDDPKSWTYLTADQLEDGSEYYIFITTSGGLYRYDINDIVRVEGYYNNTPQIVFVRKGRDMTNMTGEKLSVNQVMEAIARMSAQTGVVPLHYMVNADIEQSRYVISVELEEDITDKLAVKMLQSIDENIKMLNIEYNSKRSSLRIADPVLQLMKRGWYEDMLVELSKHGNRIFQSKIKILDEKMPDSLQIDKHLIKHIEL